MDGQHTYSARISNLPIRLDSHSVISPHTKDVEETKIHFIEQYVYEVLDFSSQYGSDTSISYTAYNLSGKPSKFPDYGDFPQAFVMKTYGNWWKEAPSHIVEYMPQNMLDIQSHDYVDVSFETSVIPFRVTIYETYNPGSVVRIWARNDTSVKKKWTLLWEGEPALSPHVPSMFSPVIRPINFKTNVLRIEFNHSRLDYYTGIDAVLLVGTESRIRGSPYYPAADSTKPDLDLTGKLTQQIVQLNLHNIPSQNTDLQSVVAEFQARTHDSNGHDDDSEVSNGRFQSLPDETILKILGYLDLTSLTRFAQTNRHLNGLAYDCFLYRCLSLRRYWANLTDDTLDTLTARCQHLQRLDLSWCGSYNMLSSLPFKRFVETCCSGLTHLRLNCCTFVTNSVVKTIADVCQGLKEMGLRNCLAVTETGFLHLTSLKCLENLDLYRTVISDSSLIAILKLNPRLQHLNIGSCVNISSMDHVAATLATYNRELVSLDLWKTGSLTQVGVAALAHCTRLQEVDFGWCLGLTLPVDSLAILANNCPRLKKLFLTALRGIGDKDLEPFVRKCKELEQVDLLGVRSITSDICLKLLMELPRLRLLDLSFCDQITDVEVSNWQKMFPKVAIKRSYQTESHLHRNWP